MNRLIERVKAAPCTSYRLAAEMSAQERDFTQLLPEKLWVRIRWFFEEIDEVRLFCGDYETASRSNGCYIAGWMLRRTVFAERIGSPSESQIDYMENYRAIGSLPTGGILAIGCADECLGKIADVHLGLLSEGGNIPIVANTFAEYLERTLDAGPEAAHCYWHLPGFEDLGPAIPGDPYYEKPAC